MQLAEHAVKGLGRKLAIAAMAATFGLGLAACDGDKTSTAAGESDGPYVGIVVGRVVDSDGNGFKATVKIANGATTSGGSGSLSVTTDADGFFTIPNVLVEGRASGGVSSSGVQLLVTPDATADVLPGTITLPVRAPDGGTGTPAGGIVLTDGFRADTGSVPFPKIDTTLTGTLKDPFGAPISGAYVNVKFRAYQPNQAVPATVATVTYTYSLGSFQQQTAPDGSFSLTVPDQSCLDISSPGLALTASNSVTPCFPAPLPAPSAAEIELVTNTPSNHTVALGTVTGSPEGTVDPVPGNPFLVSIDETLADGTITTDGKTLTLNFSELLGAGTPSVSVIEREAAGAVGSSIPATAVVSGRKITLTLASTPKAGNIVSVLVGVSSVRDSVGNTLVPCNSCAAPDNAISISYSQPGPNNTVLYSLKQPAAPRPGSSPVTEQKQALTPLTSGSVDQARLYASSHALSDLSDLTPADGWISQLQSETANGDVAATLEKLADALNPAGNPHVVHTDEAEISFVPSNGTSYALLLKRPNGDVAAVSTGQIIGDSGVDTIDTVAVSDSLAKATVTTAQITPSGAGKVSLLIKGLKPNWHLSIIPIGDNGAASPDAVAYITLKDSTKPSVALQFQGDSTASGGGGSSGGVGGGGAVSVLGTTTADVTAGGVIYPVTAQIFDIQSTAAQKYGTSDATGTQELEGLSQAELRASLSAGAGPSAVYDAAGYKAFFDSINGSKVRLGFAVTEQIDDANVPVPTVAGGLAKFSSPQVSDGVVADSKATGDVKNFLVAALVSNVLDLEKDAQAGRKISLGAISDGTNAADDATLVLKDYLPPLITSAYWTGTSFVVNFHEPIKQLGNITLAGLGAVDIGAKDATGKYVNATLSADGKSLTLLNNGGFTAAQVHAAFGAEASVNKAWYKEAVYDTIVPAAAGIALRHIRVSAKDVPDLAGNIWEGSTGDKDGDGKADVNYVAAAKSFKSGPVFALADGVVNLAFTSVSAGDDPDSASANDYAAILDLNQGVDPTSVAAADFLVTKTATDDSPVQTALTVKVQKPVTVAGTTTYVDAVPGDTAATRVLVKFTVPAASFPESKVVFLRFAKQTTAGTATSPGDATGSIDGVIKGYQNRTVTSTVAQVAQN